MSPDSALGQLAQRVARMEQRMEDVIVRFTERIGEMTGEIRRAREDADRDVRTFAPAVQDIDRHGVRLEYLADQVGAIRSTLDGLDKRLDGEREQRILALEDGKRALHDVQEAAHNAIVAVQKEAAEALRASNEAQEKKNSEHRNRITLAMFTLAGLFVSSGATLLTTLLGGH